MQNKVQTAWVVIQEKCLHVAADMHTLQMAKATQVLPIMLFLQDLRLQFPAITLQSQLMQH